MLPGGLGAAPMGMAISSMVFIASSRASSPWMRAMLLALNDPVYTVSSSAPKVPSAMSAFNKRFNVSGSLRLCPLGTVAT
ncbi:hypothetical protein D3C78_1047090 [compost metagenome]